MPHYEVTEAGKAEKRWVKAPSAAAAIKHCMDASKFSTRTMTSVDDAADLINAGVKMEDATAPAAAPPAKAE
jgi:hypothetical protein